MNTFFCSPAPPLRSLMFVDAVDSHCVAAGHTLSEGTSIGMMNNAVLK